MSFEIYLHQFLVVCCLLSVFGCQISVIDFGIRFYWNVDLTRQPYSSGKFGEFEYIWLSEAMVMKHISPAHIQSESIRVEKIHHKDESRIAVFFPYDQSIIQQIRAIPDAAWSSSLRCWHLPESTEYLDTLTTIFPDTDLSSLVSGPKPTVGQDDMQLECFHVQVDYTDKESQAIVRSIRGSFWNPTIKRWIVPKSDQNHRILEKHGIRHSESKKQLKTAPVPWLLPTDIQAALTAAEERMILEGKRHNTIKSYLGLLKSFFLAHPEYRPSQIPSPKIHGWIVSEIKTKGISRSTHNQILNAFRLFYHRVCGRSEQDFQVVRPPKERKLPHIISGEDVARLLNALQNEKHKTMLLLIYACGLRRSELLNLRIKDVQVARQMLFIRDAKGAKDRYVSIPAKVLARLTAYISNYKPATWLFAGQTGGRYSERSLTAVLEQAKERSGVAPLLTLHGLRHAYATHMVEGGVPLHVVQEALGHASIKTTSIYLHTSSKDKTKLYNPTNDLDI